MSFTRSARALCREISSGRDYSSILHRGWYETRVPTTMLQDLFIDFEVEDGKSIYCPTAVVYAPIWVFGVWFNSGMPLSWSSIKWSVVNSLLMVTRDSLKEQEMVSAEMSMDMTVPAAARRAASSLLDILQGNRKSRSPI